MYAGDPNNKKEELGPTPNPHGIFFFGFDVKNGVKGTTQKKTKNRASKHSNEDFNGVHKLTSISHTDLRRRCVNYSTS